MHVAKAGLNVLRLDQIWWMVTPQNPLKSQQPSYESRVATVKALNLPYRMKISHMESLFGTQYTVDTLRRAQHAWPETRFVFLMGADNFLQLPQWRDWEKIMHCVPIAVIARPRQEKGQGHASVKARLGQAARQYADNRLPERAAHRLQYMKPPIWTYLTLPLNSMSSSQIRANQSGE